MNEAIARMLHRYECQSVEDHVRALREIMQEIALLGLWRSKFFEKEVEPFVKNPDALEVWSREFFQDVVGRIVVV